jgi:hypothetical protein
MKDYIKAMEQEKTYFASQLESVKRSSINTPLTPTSRCKPEKSGFFGWGLGQQLQQRYPIYTDKSF